MSRFVDYFLVIGVDKDRQKTTGTIDGKILCRLPEKDWHDSPIEDSHQNLTLFCQPLGWKLSPQPHQPTFFVSVLTDVKANQRYCAYLTFWESLGEQQAEDSKRCDDDEFDCDSVTFSNNRANYVPKCLVLVSKFHYVDILRNCLSIIYTVYTERPPDVTLETVIGNLLACAEVPGPDDGPVELSLGAGDCQFLQSSKNFNVPHTGQIVYELFEQLGIHALITLFVAVMSEHKVLIHSKSFCRLHDACEGLIALMYPFRYSHVYIPLLPSSLIEVLAIPTPFLIGCHSDLKLEFEDLLSETIVVDLDCGWLQLPNDIRLPKLDDHSYNQLVSQLCQVVKPHSLHADHLFIDLEQIKHSSAPFLLDKEIRAIFLRFLAQTLQGYRNFLQVVRILPQPYITFHKSLFLGTRNLIDNEFAVRLMDSMFFSSFIQERGSPFRITDLFDKLFSELDQILSSEANNLDQFILNIRKLAQDLHLNEFSANINNPKVVLLSPSPEAIQRLQQQQFPQLDTKQIQEKIENEIIKREITSSLSKTAHCQKKLVPFGLENSRLSSSSYGEPELMITNSARRLEVLKSCVNAIFENKIADARKTFSAVLIALKSKFARLALAQELAAHVEPNSDKVELEREQFDLIVKLMNSALQQDTNYLHNNSVPKSELGDCYGLAAALLPLSICFCRKLAPGIYQFAYSCMQEHEIWTKTGFWESSFYAEVQKNLIALYKSGEKSSCKHCNKNGRCNCSVPTAREALEIAAEQLQQANDLPCDQIKQLLNNEQSTIYSQAICYVQRMVYLRLPMDVAEKEKRINQSTSITYGPHTSIGSAGDFDNKDIFGELDEESSHEEALRSVSSQINPTGEISNSVIKFVQRFIDKIAIDCDISEDRLRQLQQAVNEIVVYEMDTLNEVYKESKKLPPITKSKIIIPPMLPGEYLVMEGLRSFLVPDGREELLGNSYMETGPVHSGSLIGCVGGLAFLPAEGALFITNYRVIFRGRPWDPVASDCIVTRSFPVTTLYKEKRIHLPQALISSLDQCISDGLQMRANCFQMLRVGFDQEVDSEKIEQFRKQVNRGRTPVSIFNLFTFTSQLHASAQLKLLNLQKQKEKNGTLRGFAKKTLMKTAERTGLHVSKGKRKTKDQQISTFFNEMRETQSSSASPAALSMLAAKSPIKASSSATLGPPPIPPPPVLSDHHHHGHQTSLHQHQPQVHKERDARTLRKLLGLAYVKDYQRLKLANTQNLLQLTSSSQSQSSSNRSALLHVFGASNSVNAGSSPVNKELRISLVNMNYAISDTYPAFVVVPGIISDDSIKKICKFYKMQRFPAIVWRHSLYKTLLLRSGQLHGKGMIGLFKTHASTNVGSNLTVHAPSQDSAAYEQEKLFRAIVSLTPSQNSFVDSSYSASINSLEKSSICDLGKDTSKPSKSSSSSSVTATFQRGINKLRTSGGKSGLGTISHTMGKQLQKLNQKMSDTSDAHSVCSTLTSMSAQSQARPNGSISNASMLALGFASMDQAHSSASLCIFGEKPLLRSLKVEQLPLGCAFHPLELHEVKHVKASFKKLLRLCSPSSSVRSENDQGFLQQLEASEWMRQLQLLLNASNELVYALHTRRCSAMLCLEDGMDLVPQIISLAQICLDPYYRTFDGFRALIEKEWLAFGYRFSHRSNQNDTAGFAPIFLQFLDCVHQLLHQFPLNFQFNQYYLKFIAYHHMSGRFRTFLLDSEHERAEYGWLYEDLKRFEDEENASSAPIVGNNYPASGAPNGTHGPSSLSSSNGRSSRASSASSTSSGTNVIGTSFWDYAEAMWNKSPVFFNFSYVPTSPNPADAVILRPSSYPAAFRLWDYYTNEELNHGPSYDFEMVAQEKQRREEVEATTGGNTLSCKVNRRIVNPLYESVAHFQPNAIEEMLEQIRQLQLELGQPVQGWFDTWDKLEIPNRSTAMPKQKEVDRQISVSSHLLSRYNIAAFNQYVAGRNGVLNRPMPVKLHKFEKFNYKTPVSCDYCKKLLWDLVKNGMKCTDCGYNSHEKCFEFVAKSKCEPRELRTLIERTFSSNGSSAKRLSSADIDEEDASIDQSSDKDSQFDERDEEFEEDSIDDDDDDDDEEEEDDDGENEEEREDEEGETLSGSNPVSPSRGARGGLLHEENAYFRPFMHANSTAIETQTHAGFLCKKGALLKGWKQSWFVLDSNMHQLRYYETSNNRFCKGFINLADVISVGMAHNEPNVFDIKTNKRNYSFLAKDDFAAMEWVEKLQACLQ